MKHLEQYSLLLLEGILTIEHQTLYFLLPKRLTVLKVTKEFKHHSKTNCGPFWKVTLPAGELEKPFENWFSRKHLPNYELLVQCLAQVSS